MANIVSFKQWDILIYGKMTGCVLIVGERQATKYFKDILLKYILWNVLIEKKTRGKAINESFGLKKPFIPGFNISSPPFTLFPLAPCIHALSPYLFLSSLFFLYLLFPSFPRAKTWILVCKGEIEKQMERKTQARSVVTLTSVLLSPLP